MKKEKKIIAYLLVFILGIGLFGTGSTEAYAAEDYIMNISVQYGQTEARSMFQQINALRTGSDAWYWASDNTTKVTCEGLSELTYDYTLEKVAMQRAAEIAIYYSHTRPNGNSCFTAYSENGYSYWVAGENIAAGYMTADSVFIGWAEEDEDYAGQGHRRNMLNSNFTAVGIGHVYYNGYHYWVQEFGIPTTSQGYVEANDADTIMSIAVAASEIQEVTAVPEQSQIEVMCGQAIAVPDCEIKVLLTQTWPGRKAPVQADVAWSMTGNSYAEYSNQMITGLTAGTAELTANVYGTAVTLPVIVMHNWDSGVITREADCTETGIITYTCTGCHATKTETVAAIGHSYSSEWTVDRKATCTAAGEKSHHCSRCGAKTDITEIAAEGHQYDSGMVTKEPTCTETGIKVYTCTVCKETRTESIPKLEAGKTGLVIHGEDSIYYYENGEISTTFTGMAADETTGKKYYFEKGTAARDKQVYDSETDAWYWFDADGTMAVGKDVYVPESNENRENGKWVRYDENGAMVKGEDYRYGGWYYFDEITGEMMKGWYTAADGKTYYYDDGNGQRVYGDVVLNGIPCAFDDKTGVALDCGWYTIDGNEYWYEGGIRQGLEGRGKEIYDPASDAWYWLDAVDGGKKAVSKDVYQESSGGKWVRYDENGHMVKGWTTNSNGTYYFDLITGAMQKSWVNIDGTDYYFDEVTGILV